MAAAAKLKKQIEDDSSVVKAIAKAVSSLIVETIRNDTEIINTTASNISIKGLEESYNQLKLPNETLHLEIDNLEQYGRRNCLLFHGVKEQEGAATRSQTENTDAIVVSIMKEKLGLEISEADLDRSHRLGRKVPNVQSRPRPRPIIVKFLSYNIRSQVYRNKRILKGLGLGISESLTKKHAELPLFPDMQMLVQFGPMT
ncbi:Hypothetical predicted protein, partial [Paramuricea clavata]